MSVEDFNEHKKKKRSSATKASWLNAVYNPKLFRRLAKGGRNQNDSQQPAEYRLMAYIAVLIVIMVFILVYAVMRKNGLVN